MRQRMLVLVLGGLVTGLAGCRCCFLFEPYNDLVDCANDHRWVFDAWYNPRLDISRAGKPDWCGPINSHLAPCRCACVPPWKRFDDIWLYPPRYPYVFPGASFPGPSQAEPPEHGEEMPYLESAPLDVDVPPMESNSLPEPPIPEPPTPNPPEE